MTSEFVAFVDEAGCSGDKYNTGSSQYLVMGAVIVRRCNLNNALSAFAEAREERAKGEIQFRKFSKASDKDNFVLTKLLGRKPIRTAFVGFHKPSLTGGGINGSNKQTKSKINTPNQIKRSRFCHFLSLCTFHQSLQGPKKVGLK